MIFVENGRVKIDGTCSELMADATCILRVVYQTLSGTYGKEIINEKLVEMGRLAVMTDEEFDEELGNMDLEMR